jgi:hypothetical protein
MNTLSLMSLPKRVVTWFEPQPQADRNAQPQLNRPMVTISYNKKWEAAKPKIQAFDEFDLHFYMLWKITIFLWENPL